MKEFSRAIACLLLTLPLSVGATTAVAADIGGTWLLETANGYKFDVYMTQHNGTFTGRMSRRDEADSSINGTIVNDGFIFSRCSEDLDTMDKCQYYGGILHDSGTRMSGAFCHRTNCGVTFAA